MRILWIALLAIAAFAQDKQDKQDNQDKQDSPRHFLVEFAVAPAVDLMHLTQTQMDTFQQHGLHLMKLRSEGVVIMGGHTDNPRNMRAVVIVKTKDIAAARTLADTDPAVKAGLLKPAVEAFTLAIPPK